MGKKRKGGYEVGFGRPPKNSQFKKGQSGNPKGRPKKSMDILSVIDRSLNETVTIREGESLRQMSTREAALFAQICKAMQGNQTAFVAVMKLADDNGLLDINLDIRALPTVDTDPPVTEEEWNEAARKQQAASKAATKRMVENGDLQV